MASIRGNKKTQRVDPVIRKLLRPGRRDGQPRADDAQLRAGCPVRDASVPGLAGRPGGVPVLVGRQALRDRGRPRSGGHPGEPGLHAAPVAGEALVVRSRQGAFDRPRPELAEGLAPNANGAED